jgi:hypothetical protein
MALASDLLKRASLPSGTVNSFVEKAHGLLKAGKNDADFSVILEAPGGLPGKDLPSS